jgi:hypothetical protein
MTTPPPPTATYSPSTFPFVGGQPGQCWAGIPGGQVQVTIENNDLNNDINWGYDNNIAVGGSNTGDIPPLTSATVDGSSTIYLVGPDGTTAASILPGVTQVSASPVALATALVASGLAVQIAQAIASSGISIIGAPSLLYNISSVQPTTGPGLIGFTIPNSALVNSGCYDTGQTQAAADAAMVTILGRGSATGHVTFTKKFWSTVSDFTLPKNDMQNYALFGTKVACCHKPSFVTGRPANTNFRTDPGITAAQRAQANTDYNAFATFFHTLTVTYGFVAATQLVEVLWQEPEVQGNSMTATDYQNVIFTYGPAVNAAGVPLTLDIGSASGVTTTQAYANAGLAGAAAAGVTVGAMAQDLYMPTWLNQGVTLDAVGSIANANNLPFGVYEFGCAPNNFGTTGPADATNYLLGQSAGGGAFGILDYMQARLQAGLVNADSEYYMGVCSATGAGDLTSPIGLDPTQGLSHDFRIAIYQQLFDTLTATPSIPYTVPATSTVTVVPLAPSPVGSLGISDYLSYEVAIGLEAGAGSTNPFISLSFLWFDFDQVPKNQNPIAKEVWHLPMGANGDPNGALVVYGGGRMHGGYLQVKINNQDSQTCTVTFMTLAGTSRVGARSSLTWNPNSSVSPAVPGFTNAQASDQSLQIGREYGINVPAGTNKTFLNGLWAGEVYFRAHVTGAGANDVNFELQPVPTGVFGTGTDIFHQLIGAAGNIEILPTKLALPRCPTVMSITNNDAAAVTVEYVITAVETS